MNAAFREYGMVGAVDRQAWLFDLMRSLDGSDLSERERKACWSWAEAWSLRMTSQPVHRAPRYPYAWVRRQVRHPALTSCR